MKITESYKVDPGYSVWLEKEVRMRILVLGTDSSRLRIMCFLHPAVLEESRTS